MANSNSVTIVSPPQLLQLPEFILDDIIFCVRQSIGYDGYLCHLRLVNKKFNALILRCLCFRQVDLDRRFWRPHYLSCQGVICENHLCFVGHCIRFGDANEFYASIKLLADIQVRHTANPPLRNHYETLNLAICSLRKILEPSNILGGQCRSTDVLISIDPHGKIFTEPTSAILCKAVLEFLDITDCWRAVRRDSRDTAIYHRPHTFWRDLTLCHVGHTDFLSGLADPKHLAGWFSSMMNDEYIDVLTMAAFRGHTDLVQRMLSKVSLTGKDARRILTGACFGGNVNSVDLLLNCAPTGEIPMLCMDILEQLGVHPRLSEDAEAIFARLVPHVNPALRRTFTWNHVLAGLVRNKQLSLLPGLLVRLQNRRLHPPDWRRVAPICFGTPVWIACLRGDLDVLQVLLEGGYLRHAPQEHLESARHAYEILFDAAAYNNKPQMCMELRRRLDRSLEEMPLHSLAALDGTEDAINRIMDELDSDSPTVGLKLAYDSRCNSGRNMALYRAVGRLRVANAAILLARGIRGGEDCWSRFWVEWRYKCKHEQAFADMQALLDQYGVNRIEVIY